MVDGMLNMIPAAKKVGHIGLYRDPNGRTCRILLQASR